MKTPAKFRAVEAAGSTPGVRGTRSRPNWINNDWGTTTALVFTQQ